MQPSAPRRARGKYMRAGEHIYRRSLLIKRIRCGDDVAAAAAVADKANSSNCRKYRILLNLIHKEVYAMLRNRNVCRGATIWRWMCGRRCRPQSWAGWMVGGGRRELEFHARVYVGALRGDGGGACI